MEPLLDNIAWHALVGPQARLSLGQGMARRYAPGFSPILGFADLESPDFGSLVAHCRSGERLFCSGWTGSAPSGWSIEFQSTMFQMVWTGPAPPRTPGPELVELEPRHAQQALALATLTQPGPFGPRTIELGDYLGIFEGPRLVAMAGERMHAGRHREISGVCTHPDYQGRGHARRLMIEMLHRQLERGELPFLHVVRENAAAHGLYERMGFRDRAEVAVRVVSLK